MLKFLSIENLALIDRLQVEFQPGFNLITGETGSGKSILVDAVGLLGGKRASQEMVRQGFSKALLEGLFQLEEGHPAFELLQESGIEADEGQLIVRREISRGGTNKIFVNGRLSTGAFLSRLGAVLIDIHGQHDQQELLQPSSHLKYLDAFGENERLIRKTSEAFRHLDAIRKRIGELRDGEQERLRELDSLRYQRNEIEGLRLTPNLDEELRREKGLLSSSEKRLSCAQESYRLLFEEEGSALSLLGRASRSLQDLNAIDSRLESASARLEEARYNLEEVAFELRDYRDGVEFDPARQQQIEDRLAEIEQACRKYGRNADEILAYWETLEPRIEELAGSETQLEDLLEQQAKKWELYLKSARALSRKRRRDALSLGKAVESELTHLAMGKSVFRPEIRSDEQQPASRGFDAVEFLISPNAGEDPRPLAKTASGGELSRVILALKSVLTLENYAKTLVFDEVDSGVGGQVASSIGDRLARLAQRHQVFCVTHLPQVASYAGRHLRVSKTSDGKRTTVRITPLEAENRVEELARMLAGDEVTEAAVSHAKELLERASSANAPPQPSARRLAV